MFTHYSLDDGLSQNTVMSMAQDSKGVMWFATWNGLNRFDGTRFYNYKVQWGNPSGLSNSRIDHIRLDRYDRIWGTTYSRHACFFNPLTEEFSLVPAKGDVGLDAAIVKVEVLRGACLSVWPIRALASMRVRSAPSSCALRTLLIANYFSKVPVSASRSSRSWWRCTGPILRWRAVLVRAAVSPSASVAARPTSLQEPSSCRMMPACSCSPQEAQDTYRPGSRGVHQGGTYQPGYRAD